MFFFLCPLHGHQKLAGNKVNVSVFGARERSQSPTPAPAAVAPPPAAAADGVAAAIPVALPAVPVFKAFVRYIPATATVADVEAFFAGLEVRS